MSDNVYPPAPDQNPQPQPQAPVSYAPTVAPTENLAIWALVCAIGAWVVLPVVLAIVSLVLAKQADDAITAAAGWKQGRGLVTAARVISWIHLVLVALVVVFVVALLIGLAVGG
jgi:hypothetical protein